MIIGMSEQQMSLKVLLGCMVLSIFGIGEGGLELFLETFPGNLQLKNKTF